MRFLDKLGIGLVLSAIVVFLFMITLVVLVTIRLIDNMKVSLRIFNEITMNLFNRLHSASKRRKILINTLELKKTFIRLELF